MFKAVAKAVGPNDIIVTKNKQQMSVSMTEKNIHYVRVTLLSR